jgi:DNA-binding NarL/FixJ family response regulator
MYIHLRKYFREHAALPEEGAVMEAIFSEYNISPREQEIIRLISRGKSNKEIADVLFISLQTVKHHIHSIYRKLNVKNRVQLSNFFRNAPQ